MHPVTSDNRYQIGDPGRYLRPGLFQKLLTILEEENIDPAYGYTLELVDPETGECGRITGIRTALIGVAHPDDGNRDLGEFLTETGHIAVAQIGICVEPAPCEQCRWIAIDEPVSIIAGPGMLMIHGSIEHLHIETVMPISSNASKILPMRKAA